MSTNDIILLSACSFLGNIGAALTGFGQAIIYLFVWQIVELAGYDGDFKYAVFIQALSLFSMQPLLLYKAQVLKHAHRRILILFVPITLVSTPLGQLVSAYVPTKIVQAVAGGLVTFVACFEIYRKRNWFLSICKKKNEEEKGNENNDDDMEAKEDIEKCIGKETTYSNKEDEFKDNSNNRAEGKQSGSENDGEKSDHDDSSKDATNQKLNQTETHSMKNATFQQNKTEDTPEEIKIGLNKITFWTLLAGGASGFLGGMVAIRGPPLIFYFLHPPKPVSFNKNSQRATGVVIMFFNVFMRQIFYLVNTFSDSDKIGYEKDDWQLYLSVIICSIAGGLVGSKLFEYLKDSKDTIRGILAIFLFMCGVSLLFSAFR